jgi:hypothetical protein
VLLFWFIRFRQSTRWPRFVPAVFPPRIDHRHATISVYVDKESVSAGSERARDVSAKACIHALPVFSRSLLEERRVRVQFSFESKFFGAEWFVVRKSPAVILGPLEFELFCITLAPRPRARRFGMLPPHIHDHGGARPTQCELYGKNVHVYFRSPSVIFNQTGAHLEIPAFLER